MLVVLPSLHRTTPLYRQQAPAALLLLPGWFAFPFVTPLAE
jgi:hypothetical protein